MYGQIYIITNKINGKRYVGQTTASISRRWKAHCREASKGKNKAFSNAIRKYGADAFELRAIADAPDHDTLNNFEYFYIRHLDTMNPDKGYNRREGGNQPKFGPETIAKFSAARRGRKLTPEWRKKIGDALKGRAVSEKNREINRQRMLGNTCSLGIKRSEETKEKMRKPKSLEARKNMSAGRKGKGRKFGSENPFFGRKHSQESLAKMRKPRSEEYKKAMSEARKGENGPTFRHDVPTQLLVDLYAQGLGTVRIGKQVGLNCATVFHRLKSAGVELRKSAWRVANGG